MNDTDVRIEKIDFTEPDKPSIEIDHLLPKKSRKLPVKKLNEEIIRKTFEASDGLNNTRIRINSTVSGEAEFSYNATVNWGEFDVASIVDKMVMFSEKLNGLPLHPYQIEPQRRIFESVLLNDGEEISVIVSRQAGKCFARGTAVRMWDGTVKNVEDISVGDELLGDDSNKRTVLSTHSGTDKLYRVVPKLSHGEEYVVNSRHTMVFRTSYKSEIVEIPIEEYIKLSNYQKNENLKCFKAPVEWPYSKTPVEPYFLGIWLGDGKSRGQDITSADNEIVEYIHEYANRLGLSVSKYCYDDSDCADYSIVGERWKPNPLRDSLKPLFLNKHIPKEYMRNSRFARLELLAGIIDSDGHKPTAAGKENTCEIVLKDYILAKDVLDLARSLGFRASINSKNAKIKKYEFECEVYRISIYGDLSCIPTKILRKKWSTENTVKNDPLSYGISIEDAGIGEYFGFEVDGNKRFLLEDFTVVHNSEMVAQTCNALLVLMPILAQVYPKQLGNFRRGIRIGLFAPVSEQAFVTHRRMDMRLSGEHAEMILSDPDLQAQKKYSGGMIQIWGPMEILPNGKSIPSYHSYCKVQSAAKQSKIESATYDVILCDETQDIDSMKLEKSIHPMGASTNATLVKIGTASSHISNFYHTIQRNKRKELQTRVKNHFEADYKVVQKYNTKYRAYIQREKERLGEGSDPFRMSYALEWLLEKGMAMTPQMFEEYLKDPSLKFEYTPEEGATYVGGLDLGKENDSTILTIGKIVAEAYMEEDGAFDEKYIKTVVNWLEMTGDNWEIQFETIQSMVRNYGLKILCTDSTGVGDPIIDRLEKALEDIDCTIVPVTFNLKSKHEMTTIFYEEMRAHRIKIPCHQSAKKTRRYQNFLNQFYSCEKIYKGAYVQLKHPDEKDARDDYVDSLLLLCYGVSQQVFPKVSTHNKDYGLFSAKKAGQKHTSKRYDEAIAKMKRAYAGKWRRYVG